MALMKRNNCSRALPEAFPALLFCAGRKTRLAALSLPTTTFSLSSVALPLCLHARSFSSVDKSSLQTCNLQRKGRNRRKFIHDPRLVFGNRPMFGKTELTMLYPSS